MKALLATRRFLPLFLTQFLGAFNDNVFKNALVMFVTYKVASSEAGNAQVLVVMAGALFILPYFLFSATAGQVADKYDRAFLARVTKVWETIIVAIAAMGFYMGNALFLLLVLFCLGVQATFFGPIKYALLPQHLREEELLSGNAYIEAGTFLAILLGTICGGLLIMSEQGTHLIALAMISCALGGYMASRHIPTAPAPMPALKLNWNIATETWKMVKRDYASRRVFASILGISWFWLVGATFLSQFPAYAKNYAHADETVVTLFLTVFSVGIGIGSFLCNWLLQGEIKTTYVAWAALGISLFTLDLYVASAVLTPLGDGRLMTAAQFLGGMVQWRILCDMLMIAVCGGIYIVPLYAVMQHDSEPEYRARTIASNNVINAAFMVAAALLTVAMLAMQRTIPDIFLSLGIANMGVVWFARKFTRPA